MLLPEYSYDPIHLFYVFFSRLPPYIHNARLRGWQRTTTKPKHNNRNHRGPVGLETPRVDSPS
ncbi:hypothetical protein CLP36_17885 [Vibrio cholerae]|nr:hypothetical protein [Vibrio cholerae]EGR4184922.1 hypothetical protein [Vibrio cholerae]EGR5487299.1 hypothetical protein [Vibrio cholerae]